MPPSVSFADQLVTDCHVVPRLSKDRVRDYFYSSEDIKRFSRIWKSIVLQRMEQIESEECEKRGNVVTKRTLESDQDERPSSSKRRRCHDGNEKSAPTKVLDTPAEAVQQVVRSVSPMDR